MITKIKLTQKEKKQITKILLFSIISIIIVISIIKYNIKLEAKSQEQNIKIELSKAERGNYPEKDGIWGTIEIPSIKINTNLYKGNSLENGALHHKESYFPSDGGTILIVGTDKYLKNLSDIQINDKITIKTMYGTYKYKVEQTEIKPAEKLSEELKITNKEEKLVLYTAYSSTSEHKNNRFVVYASLVGDNK